MRTKARKCLTPGKSLRMLIQPRYSSDDDDESFTFDDSGSDDSQSSRILEDQIEHKSTHRKARDAEEADCNGIIKVNNISYKMKLSDEYKFNTEKKLSDTINQNNEETILDSNMCDEKLQKRKKNALSICVTNSRYTAVARVAKAMGWKLVREGHLWNIFWADSIQSVETCKDMKRFQKINHFPGMTEICRKDLLARNLNRMHRLFPAEYNIFPKTWCFPADLGEAVAYSKEHKNKTYIIKPDQGAQGRGIWLTKSLKEFKPTERMICQVYITKPLLVDGYKFDLRVYTLVTSVDPLRIFVYNEGLARFATSKYKEPSGHNTSNVYMHLTNYSVNKHSRTFCKDDEAGSKRKLSTLNKILVSEGYDVEKLWRSIDDIIIKTILSAWPMLKHNYHACFPCHDITQACFEILGFDILVDSKLKPYILEVNHSPSFHTDENIDKDVKESLIRDTFKLLNISVYDKKRVLTEDKKRVKKRLLRRIRDHQKYFSGVENEIEEERKKCLNALAQQVAWEENHLGGFRRIMPVPNDPNKYVPFFILQKQASIYSDTAASKRREEAAKQLRSALIERDKKNRQIITTKLSKKPTQPVEYKTASARKRRKDKMMLRRQWSMGNLICDSEERERVMLLSQRDFLVRNSGIFQQLYESFYRHELLSESDRRKYKDIFQKLEANQLNVVEISSEQFQQFPEPPNNIKTHNKNFTFFKQSVFNSSMGKISDFKGKHIQNVTKINYGFTLPPMEICAPKKYHMATQKLEPSKYFDIF